MCLANDSRERGVILLDVEDIAATLDIDEAEYTAFVAKLERKGIVTTRADGGVVLTNWITRQYDKPSDAPEETARRQRDKREREKPVTPESRASHALSRPILRYREYTETDTETETETENTQRQSPPDCQADAQSEIAQKVETLKTAEQKQVAPLPKQKKIPLPTEPETLEYFTAKGRPELASGFWDYWESVGWKRRGQRMDDWRATVRTWINRQDEKHAPPPPITFSNGSRASPNSGRPVNNPAQTIDDIAAEIMNRSGGQNELYTEQTASDFYGESQAITIQHQHALVGSNRADVPHRIP